MIITEFDTVFSERTGVTVLLPKNPAFDPGESGKNAFCFHTENESADITIVNGTERAVLKNVKSAAVKEAVRRGMFMIYELDGDDEIVRISVCELSEK